MFPICMRLLRLVAYCGVSVCLAQLAAADRDLLSDKQSCLSLVQLNAAVVRDSDISDSPLEKHQPQWDSLTSSAQYAHTSEDGEHQRKHHAGPSDAINEIAGAAGDAINEIAGAAGDAMNKISGGTGRKNVLFIVVDDLRPNIGAYNFSLNGVSHTPHMDQLAKDGLTFKRAYVQFPFCAPSRNSFMTGRRPDATRAFNFLDDFRQTGIGEHWQTLPEYFKNHDYLTYGEGKLFHHHLPKDDDHPRSWSEPIPAVASLAQISGKTYVEVDEGSTVRVCALQEPAGNIGKPTFCAVNISADETDINLQLPDMKTRDRCIANLRHAHGAGGNFFIGCGFIKPHVPWEMPLEFFERIPEDVPMPAMSNATLGMPDVAWHTPADIMGMLCRSPTAEFRDPAMDPVIQRRGQVYRRAYYAAVAFVDDSIGRVVKELDNLGHRDDTVVIVFGDHGWHLGEHNLWGKFSNFELDLRIPTFMRAPWLTSATGKVTNVLAEAVDFYPTLAELAGLPDPTSMGEEHISGVSLARVFENPGDIGFKSAAFSQTAKQTVSRPFAYWPIPPRKEIGLMGYSMRTDTWRYTAWFQFDGEKPILDTALARELYAHVDDDSPFDSSSENVNVLQEHEAEAATLHRDLLRHIEDHIALPRVGKP